MSDNEPIHLSKTEARAGTSSKMNRYVLAISLALVIVLFVVIVGSGWMR